MIDIQKSTIGAWLNRVAHEHPDHEALIHHQRGVRLNYRALMEQAGKLARGLMALGIQKGDPVALWGVELSGMGPGPGGPGQNRGRSDRPGSRLRSRRAALRPFPIRGEGCA